MKRLKALYRTDPFLLGLMVAACILMCVGVAGAIQAETRPRIIETVTCDHYEDGSVLCTDGTSWCKDGAPCQD